MDAASLGRLVGACVVIGLVLALVNLVARRGLRLRLAGGSGRLVTLLETTHLPGAASVHVLRIADRYVVVGRAGGSVAPICEIAPERAEAALAAAAPRRRRAG